MTPERIEEIKLRLNNNEYIFYEYGQKMHYPTKDVTDLLAALEESQQQLTKREDMLRESLNITRRLENRLAEAQQTIAQMKKGDTL